MMQIGLKRPTKTKHDRRPHGAAVVVFVTALHVLLFAGLGLTVKGPVDLPEVPIISVDLIRPPEPDPPRLDLKQTIRLGGGAPSAPSKVHVPEKPPEVPKELPLAPKVQAPEPPLVIGAAPKASPEPGPGQGQSGEGSGTGDGEGSGPGIGSGPRFIQGAQPRHIRAALPRNLPMQAHRPVQLSCVIRRDRHLEACRVVSDDPAVLAYGQYFIAPTEAHFRFAPPTRADGSVIEGHRVTVNYDYRPRG